MGNSAIGHACEHARVHARGLNPLARGYLISPDANFLLRQWCALLRTSRSRHAPWPLTAMDRSHSKTSCNDSHQGMSAQQPDGAHGHSTGNGVRLRRSGRGRTSLTFTLQPPVPILDTTHDRQHAHASQRFRRT